ncbi:hypothetical protein PVAP13_9NG460200 [Panicum virgatum]|uniref:Uncharacterized protein n=1 Tax=Panicum virgatum TaxID=38727 RepID=A0A8T0MRK6_PANVG|nr:hypothetical protein PVAP13_9NG460200 [Panicum virgatum]
MAHRVEQHVIVIDCFIVETWTYSLLGDLFAGTASGGKRFHALVVLPLRRPPPTHSSVWAAIAATPLLPHRRTLAMPPLLATNLVHARS